MKNNYLYGIVLICISCILYSCISYRERPNKLYNQVISNRQVFDVGIVPGVPFKNGKWDTVMKGRVIWAYNLYKKGIVKNFIFSGNAVYSPYYEAKIMGLYALQLGIPQEHILYDTLAEHSTENIFNAYELARKEGFKTIALVTDPFQSSMTKGFTKRRFRTYIQHLPFLVDTLKIYNDLEPTINPSSAFKEHFISIKKRQSFFTRFWGTLGKRIKWNNNKMQPAL